MVGLLGYYDKDEIQKYKDIQYIAKLLRVKHFDMKNGKAADRLLNDKGYIAQKTHKLSDKKKEEFEKKVIAAVNRIVTSRDNFVLHGNIADKAFKRASNNFPSTNGITITATILALLRKTPSAMKHYKFNQKNIDKINNANKNEKTLIFSSSRVATELLKCLDEEIAHYYFNLKEVA